MPRRRSERSSRSGQRRSDERGVVSFATFPIDGRHMSLLRVLQAPPQPQADLRRVYDAIVIGSGAAGGLKHSKVYSYVQGWSGPDYSRNMVVDEKEHPYSGTNYAWVRARCLGGKTNIWGRLALRLSDYDFKAKSHDGYGEDWPLSYKDLASYYDKVDLYLGISGVKENLPHLPDSLFQRPTKLNVAEVRLRESLKKMGRVLTPYRAGVTTDGLKHNKYRSRCLGRGACSRRAGGCDIHAAFDSPTGLIYPAMDTGNLTLRTNSTCYEVTMDPATGKARGVAFVDTETG